MQKNMGGADSFIRTLIGISFLVNIIILEPTIFGGIVLFVLGALFIGTAWIQYCPAYKPLGVCTCSNCNCACSDAAKGE